MAERAIDPYLNFVEGRMSTIYINSYLQANPVLLANLVSFWELEEASGNRADAHGSNTLTDNNTVTNNTGKVGNAAEFNAANSEYLSRASNSTLQAGNIDFVVGFWVYLSNVATTQILVAKYGSGGNLEYRFDIASSRFRFLVSPDGVNLASVTANTFGAPSNNTWYFVTGWHDATANTINISVNAGTPDSTAHATGVYAGSAPFTIGASGFPATYATGRVDQVLFAKEVYSSTTRTWLYNSGNGRSYAEVAAYTG